LHERSIDESTYKEQVDLLNEEITLAELAAHDSKLEEIDIEASLNFATNALGNAAAVWIQCSADQKQRFQKVLFPNGLVFDGESYRTAETCLGFSYLREISEGNASLALLAVIEP
jgi:hypothetical protein